MLHYPPEIQPTEAPSIVELQSYYVANLGYHQILPMLDERIGLAMVTISTDLPYWRSAYPYGQIQL